jgi:hypothetical protein
MNVDYLNFSLKKPGNEFQILGPLDKQSWLIAFCSYDKSEANKR